MWFSKVIKDLSCIPDAIDYYENEHKAAKIEVALKGNVEKAASMLPGIVEYRFGQLQEIEAILNHLNIQHKKIKSKHFRKYLENYQKALSANEVNRYVEGEVEVVAYDELVNEFALLRNKWLGIMKGLDTKGYSINNIVKLRTAGIEDASV